MLLFLIFFILCRKRKQKFDDPAETPSPSLSLKKHFMSHSTTKPGAAVYKHGHSNSEGNSTLVPIVPLEIDQRLDPRQIIMKFENNDGDSRKSLQDEYDYSRKVLSVRNP